MKGLSAKQLKSPDEFFKSFIAFLRYVKGNAKLIISLGVVIILCAAGYVTFEYFSEKSANESWNVVFDAENKLKNSEASAKNDDEALKVYKETLNKVKTDSSKSYLMLKMADRYYSKKEWDNASEYYGKVVDKDNGLLKQLALLGFASSKEMKGDVNAALEKYLKLSSDEMSVYRPMAMLGLARCYAKSGNKAKAQESYDNVIIAFPETDYARIASTSKLGI